MSIFKDKAIVLKIDKLKDKELFYTLFTYEYGKIKAVKKINKKEKNLDLGYIINFEIVTKEDSKIHKIKNIKIKNQFNISKNTDFSQINKYLEILRLLYIEIPDGISNKEIFNIIEFINKYEKINEFKLILAELKIKSLLGNLDIQNENKNVEKILKFINKNKIDDIFKLSGFDDEIKAKIKSLT